MACKSCNNRGGQNSGAGQAMAPIGVAPQQAMMQGVQYGNQYPSANMQGNQFPQSQRPDRGWGLQDTPGYNQVFPTMTPYQMGLANYAGQAAGNLIGQGGGPDYSGFGPIEQRARTQFNEQTLPSIAERFTGTGYGAQNSSAFHSQLGAYASDFDQGIAALRSQHGIQQQGLNNQRLGILLQGGLQNQLHNHYTEPTPGLFNSLASGIGKAAPYAAALL